MPPNPPPGVITDGLLNPGGSTPLPPSDPTLSQMLHGPWVGSYLALSLIATPLTEAVVLNPLPQVGNNYLPSSAMIRILFAGQSSFIGKVKMNFCGTKAADRPFEGTYDIAQTPDLGIVEGEMRLDFPGGAVAAGGDPFTPGQQTCLHFAMRSRDEMIFMLHRALLPPGSDGVRRATAGGATVRGTLHRVLPIDLA